MRKISFIIMILALILTLTKVSYSQIIVPNGNPSEPSSQLVYYFDEADNQVKLQITNVNDTESVWIHVQLFRTFNVTRDPLVNIFCDEKDFVDLLTPKDTHIYVLQIPNFPRNIGETQSNIGESTTLDTSDSMGFAVITPVISESDLTAISFQHLIGVVLSDRQEFVFNAMGRDAVDFSTAEIVPDLTPLDGITNGYVVVQPDELLFDFAEDNPANNGYDVVGLVFKDNYGPPGLLGYKAEPASANWTSFIFDFKEDPTSCGNRVVDCFITLGINEIITQHNKQLNSDTSQEPGDLLCAGTESLEYPIDIPIDDFALSPPCGDSSDPSNNIGGIGCQDDFMLEFFGWARIFISGLDDFENHFGAILNEDIKAMRWMLSR